MHAAAFEAGSAFAMGAAASNTHEGFAMTVLSLPFLAAKIAKERFASIAEVDAMYEGLIADEGIKGALCSTESVSDFGLQLKCAAQVLPVRN